MALHPPWGRQVIHCKHFASGFSCYPCHQQRWPFRLVDSTLHGLVQVPKNFVSCWQGVCILGFLQRSQRCNWKLEQRSFDPKPDEMAGASSDGVTWWWRGTASSSVRSSQELEHCLEFLVQRTIVAGPKRMHFRLQNGHEILAGVHATGSGVLHPEQRPSLPIIPEVTCSTSCVALTQHGCKVRWIWNESSHCILPAGWRRDREGQPDQQESQRAKSDGANASEIPYGMLQGVAWGEDHRIEGSMRKKSARQVSAVVGRTCDIQYIHSTYQFIHLVISRILEKPGFSRKTGYLSHDQKKAGRWS